MSRANAANITVNVFAENGGVQKTIKTATDAAEDAAKPALLSMQRINAMASASMIGLAGITFELFKAVQAAMVFESAFAGIRKTVDATEEQFEELAQSILRMSTVAPIDTTELSRIGELGGQLGILAENLPSFIRTIADLAISTNLTVDGAALGLARLDAIAGTNQETFANIGATIVELGNNFAATESEIMTTVLRIQQAAAQVGATTQDALAFATALQAIGVPAQAGGTAVARVFQSINQAVIQGGENLELFGKIAEASGRTTEEAFKQFFQDDPALGAQAFIEGLGKLNESGQDVISMLDKLGLAQRRTMLAILGLAEAEGLLNDTRETANKAFEENIALTEESIKRYKTLESQVQVTKNAFMELQNQIGEQLLPQVQDINNFIQKFILGLTASEQALQTLEMAMVSFATVIGFAITQIARLQKALLFFVGGPIRATLTAIGVLMGVLGTKTAAAAGAQEQLNRQLEYFGENGEVTESTLRAVIKANQDFQKVIEGMDFGQQLRLEDTIVEGLMGNSFERKQFIGDLEETIEQAQLMKQVFNNIDPHAMAGEYQRQLREIADGVISGDEAIQKIIEIVRSQSGVILSPEEAHPLYNAIVNGNFEIYMRNQSDIIDADLEFLLAQEQLAKRLLPGMEYLEERKTKALEAEAMRRLGIYEIEHDFQRVMLEQTMAAIEAEKERANALDGTTEQIEETEDIFQRIAANVKSGGEQLFSALDQLGDLATTSAEDVNRALAEKIQLREVFEKQIQFLKDRGFDDVALEFSQLGPEFAGVLANLIANTDQLNAREMMLESLGLSESNELKDALFEKTGDLSQEAQDKTYEMGQDYVRGFINGLNDEAPESYEAVKKVMQGILDAAYEAGGFGSPSRITKEMGEFLMLGFAEGIESSYPELEMSFKGKMIDLLDVMKQSVSEAMGAMSSAFGSQFSMFGAQRSALREEQKLNDLLEERGKLLKGNTAAMTKDIEEATAKRDFLKLAYEEGTISLAEYQLAEEQLSKAENARADRLQTLDEQIQDANIRAAENQFNMGMQAFQLLQAGPEAITIFKELGSALGVDEEIINNITNKTDELAQTLGMKFGGEVDKIAQKFFDTNLAIEQETITINADGSNVMAVINAANAGIDSVRSNASKGIKFNAQLFGEAPGFAGLPNGAAGGRIKGYYKGGILGSGMGLVGEYGPELIRAIPGGGVDITPLGDTRGSSLVVQNLNVNVTGVPSDPMQARKAAIEIRKALVKLDKEGLVGTGIRGR